MAHVILSAKLDYMYMDMSISCLSLAPAFAYTVRMHYVYTTFQGISLFWLVQEQLAADE